MYAAEGDVATALVLAQRLVRLRPYADHYALLGHMLLLGANRDAARRAFERALEIDRRCEPARRGLEGIASD